MRKKSKITEQDLIDLGFEKKSETVESSGSENDWHYYTLDIADMCLISNDNEDAEKDDWLVYIFDDVGIVFRNTEDLAQLVQLLKRNQTQNG
jgi:hypothetical protein